MGQYRDCLTCPAHQHSRWSFSQWVHEFTQVLDQIQYQGVVIHDWNDVPGNRHMHWDATLFLGGVAHRIEIDGPRHDLVVGQRLMEDMQKDHIVCAHPSRSLLRLTYHDVHAWPLKLQLYLQCRMQLLLPGVWGTAWYLPFQGQGFGMLNII